jgi:hypothetical protein
MVKFVFYDSGSVLCCAPDDCGSIAVLCTDPELTPLQRADRARQQVQEVLDRLTVGTRPQQPVLTEVHEAPAHRRESSD